MMGTDNPFQQFAGQEEENPFKKFTPSVGETVADAAIQLASGVPRGFASLIDLPGHVVDYAAKKLGASGPIIDDGSRARTIVDRYLPEPRTAAGRYSGAAGEAIGASIVPMAGMYAAAPGIVARSAAAPAQTWLGRAVQGGAQQIVNAPARTAVLDVASAATSGLASHATAEAGYGPAAQLAAGIVGGMVPGVAASYVNAARGAGGGIGNPQAQSMARQRQIAAERDIQAFDAADVRTFGPAFNQGPVASVGKQLAETPFVGAPLRNNLDETYHDMAAAAGRLANDISPAATPESAGAAAQRGLDRFRHDGMARLEPGVVEALGVPSIAPVPRAQVMSAGQAVQAATAAPIRQAIGANVAQTTRGATVPAARPLSQTLTTRTTPEMLSDAELASVVRAPAHETSVATRAEALYERALRMVPDMMRSNGTANPNLVPTVNTAQALRQIDGAIANQISGQGTINGALMERLIDAQSNFTLVDLRAVRTEVGRALSNFNPMTQSLDRSQLRGLYAATSRDIELGLETLANRAAIGTQRGNNAANRVTPEVARQAAGALHAFRTADRYYRTSMERMDRFAQVLQAQSPEMAARRLTQASLQGTRGNVRMFRAAMAGLRPEERAEFGALVVRELGNPVDSARGIVQESGFSAQSFVTRYQRMSEDARNLVFSPEHRRALDNLFQVANRIANVEALANTSRTGTNTMNMTGTVGAVGSALMGDFVTPLAIGASGMATSLLMSSPKYTQWMSRYITLRAAVRDGTDQSIAPLMRHIGALERGARLHPELWPAYAAVTEDIESMRQKH